VAIAIRETPGLGAAASIRTRNPAIFQSARDRPAGSASPCAWLIETSGLVSQRWRVDMFTSPLFAHQTVRRLTMQSVGRPAKSGQSDRGFDGRASVIVIR
jgi:hypothetical protein